MLISVWIGFGTGNIAGEGTHAREVNLSLFVN